jgi:hypothetical protein
MYIEKPPGHWRARRLLESNFFAYSSARPAVTPYRITTYPIPSESSVGWSIAAVVVSPLSVW